VASILSVVLSADCLGSAEYILDAIGAGATATTDTDWHGIWKSSPQAKAVDEELDGLLEDGRKRHAVDTEQHSEFSTRWIFQVKTLWERDIVRHWRDPTYMMAKLALNIVAGLFIGFTFFKAKDSIQGTQNKIFVSIGHWSPSNTGSSPSANRPFS
jgi:ATP-binding cassette subfamily G (WHITE) protein 2 (SNQ2)